MIKQIAHVCINSKNLNDSLCFYRDILGLKVAFEFERDSEVFGYYFRVGYGTYIEVFKGESGDSGKIKHIALEVDNIDEIISDLRSKGKEISDKCLGADNTWQAWTKDPDGVPIEFHQYTEKSMQIYGGKCVINSNKNK